MLGTELPATVAFDYPTLAGMARYIAERSVKTAQRVSAQSNEATQAQEATVREVRNKIVKEAANL